MNIIKKTYGLFPSLLIAASFAAAYFCFLTSCQDEYSNEGCTIGVVSGRSTPDGRPILWKLRDNGEMPNNDIVFDSSCTYNFIAVVNNGDSAVWMGVNEKGLAIVNSTAYDLPGTTTGFSNGSLMYHALGYCKSVEEFESILIKTNQTGRKTRANFGLIDATGAAVIYETSGNNFWKYDANNNSQSAKGYVVRTNFSFAGGSTSGLDRYNRTVSLVESLLQQNELSHQSIIKNHFRDFSNERSEKVLLPYKYRWFGTKPFGYINSNYSVCRNITLSASVFHGVLPSEEAITTTMWTALGNPSSTVTLPYWAAGVTPSLTHDVSISPLYKSAEIIKSFFYDDPMNRNYFDSYKLVDEYGRGIISTISNFEYSLLTEVENKLNELRSKKSNITRLLQIEHDLCEKGFDVIETIRKDIEQLIRLDVYNSKPWREINNVTFSDESVIQLISSGRNGKIDEPILNESDINFAKPGGDDYLIGENHFVGENSIEQGKFYIRLMLWGDDNSYPVPGEKIFLRIFNSNKLNHAEYYGNSQLFSIHKVSKQFFNPEIIEVRELKSTSQYATNLEKISEFGLSNNYPNPFNPVTNFSYSLPEDAAVKLIIYNSLGEQIATLVDEFKNSGEYYVQFDAHSFASGIYYYKLTANNFVSIKKMLMVK